MPTRIVEDIELWQPPRQEVLKLKKLMTLRERLIRSKMSLTTPIDVPRSIGDKETANMLMSKTKAAISGIEKSLKEVDKQLDEIVRRKLMD